MDLSPGYRELPAPAAAGLACLWVHVAGPRPGAPARILPDGCSDLIWRAGEGVHVAGPDTTAALADLAPGSVVVGARFAPGAGGPALGVPLSAWRDARIPLDGIADPGLDPGEALRRLAAHAAALVRRAPADAAVWEAGRRLAADPRLRVEALAADLGLSQRQLRRRCLAAAGHPPKVLQRVLRFRAFVAAADATGAAPDLARLAFEHGYADQAHLTNEVSELAGLPPATLIRTRRDGAAGARAAG